MPRKAKEKVVEKDILNEEKDEKIKEVKKSSKKTKKASKDIEAEEKKVAPKRGRKKTEAVDLAEKETASSKKTASKKKATATKKSTTSEKKTTTRKRVSTKKSASQNASEIQILEYYDLPYKYGNTIVKLLAQTPKTLFVYWEISDEDINNFKKQYGEDFLNITKPILIVHDLTLNKTSEVEINDFANCWYLNIENANCKYDIELARKFTNNVSSSKKSNSDEYLYIAKSNDLQAPNDHIMFENLSTVVTFKNYQTDENIEENIESFKFLKDIYKFYQNMYKDELLKNPSSKF